MSTELSELFDRDPLHLTDADLDKIIARMREAQVQHELGAKAPKPLKPKTAKPGTIDILKDLGLA